MDVSESQRLRREQARVLLDEAERARRDGLTVGLQVGRSEVATEIRVERRRSRRARKSARARAAVGASRLGPGELLRRTGGACYLCGRRLTAASCEIEHIIPIGRGGEHVDENLAPACRPCNLRKADRFVAFDVASRTPIFVPCG